MKRLIIVFGLFWITCPLFASFESLESYRNFKINKEMWVCTSIAFPVDISYDVFNVDFKTIAQNRNGYFIQVKPGSHVDAGNDGKTLPDADDIIQSHASGVLNVVGKPAGIYEYIFVSTDDDFCGMKNGEQAVVRIYLVPQLVGFPVLTNVCPGKDEPVDFNKFIPPEVKYFIDAMGWKIAYTTSDGKTPVTMPVKAGLFDVSEVVKNSNYSNVGDNVYLYTIDDSEEGPFKGKYLELKSSVYYCPEDSASLTHTVRIREDEEYVIPDKSISFCTDLLTLVPETSENLNVNLFGYLGSSAPGGKWSIEYKGDLTDESFPTGVDESGNVSIPINFIIFFDVDRIVFKYSYEDCMSIDTFTLLTFNFNKSTYTNIFVDQERDICRNLMSGVVELSSIFGFTAPLTSGIWYEKVGDDFEERLDGTVDISKMKSGSLYTFQYYINSAVDEMCLLQGNSTLFQLRMHDLEVANAEAKICKKQLSDGVSVDLTQYVAGLNDTARIDPKRITWKNPEGKEVPSKHTLTAPSGWLDNDTILRYQYEVTSNCGPYSGNLYISTIDSTGVDTARKVTICYTDDYAKHIDLYQVLGIVGAKGTFEICDDPVNDKKEKLANPVMKGDNGSIMDAYESFKKNDSNDDDESQTYTFCYMPPSNDTCVSRIVEITIQVTRNIENNTDFKQKNK